MVINKNSMGYELNKKERKKLIYLYEEYIKNPKDEFIKKDGLVGVKLCYKFDNNPFKTKELNWELRSKLFFYFHTNFPADWFQKQNIVRQVYPESSCSVFILTVSKGKIEAVY